MTTPTTAKDLIHAVYAELTSPTDGWYSPLPPTIEDGPVGGRPVIFPSAAGFSEDCMRLGVPNGWSLLIAESSDVQAPARLTYEFNNILRDQKGPSGSWPEVPAERVVDEAARLAATLREYATAVDVVRLVGPGVWTRVGDTHAAFAVGTVTATDTASAGNLTKWLTDWLYERPYRLDIGTWRATSGHIMSHAIAIDRHSEIEQWDQLEPALRNSANPGRSTPDPLYSAPEESQFPDADTARAAQRLIDAARARRERQAQRDRERGIDRRRDDGLGL